MSLPHDFKTRQQLDEYVRCLRNVRVGDDVECFMTSDGYISSIPKDRYKRYEVIVVCNEPERDVPGWGRGWNRWRNDDSTWVPFIVLGSSDGLRFNRHSEWIKGIRDLITKSNPKYPRSQHLLHFNRLVKAVFHK